jgi:hypothetical protein
MIARTAALALGVTLCFFFVLALPAHAQFNTFTYGTNLSIGLSPQYPGPGDSVHLTALGNGFDIASSAIVWHADGKIIAQGVGTVSADVVAGALGSATDIEVDVAAPDGSVWSAQATIAPTELDLLVSSDSYTPPFYRGRALPSAGTNLIAQALTRFERPDGTLVPDSDITYTWKRDGEVLGTLSGPGKSSAVIPVMHLFTNDVIAVDAVSSDGLLSGEASAIMPSVEPVLDLYEDHPLYGVLYNNALRTPASVSESEMAFAAVPYFAQTGNPNDTDLSYTWRVNDTPVSSSATSPSELTINADNSNGQALIDLEVTRATNFYMDARGLWNVVFPGAASAQDGFHATAQL